MLTSQIRPLNNLVKNKTATSFMQVITGRELTAEEISLMSRNPPEKPTSEPPASTGYFQSYTEDANGTGVATFVQNCSKDGEKEMPEDRDATTCGWTEVIPLAIKEIPDEFRWTWGGTVKRPPLASAEAAW